MASMSCQRSHQQEEFIYANFCSGPEKSIRIKSVFTPAGHAGKDSLPQHSAMHLYVADKLPCMLHKVRPAQVNHDVQIHPVGSR